MLHFIKDRFLKDLRKRKSLLSSSVNQEFTKSPSHLKLMLLNTVKYTANY